MGHRLAGLYKAFHQHMLQAQRAQNEYRATGRGIFGDDQQARVQMLHSQFPPEIVRAALKLENGEIAEAHEILWKLVRPFGREESYYFEGKGE